MLRSRQCRFKQRRISNSRGSTVLGKQTPMHRQHDRFVALAGFEPTDHTFGARCPNLDQDCGTLAGVSPASLCTLLQCCP